jgi:cysteinyl-tRNA synthetase
MSKSLKNFTTSREALSKGAWTPRSLRIVFLFGGCREGIEVTDEVVLQASSWEQDEQFFHPSE